MNLIDISTVQYLNITTWSRNDDGSLTGGGGGVGVDPRYIAEPAADHPFNPTEQAANCLRMDGHVILETQFDLDHEPAWQRRDWLAFSRRHNDAVLAEVGWTPATARNEREWSARV